jgi:DNA primase
MAGRIPQAFLDDLLDRVDIVDVIDRRVKLKKSGKNYSARCPFHDEKTPSFSVSPDKQFYYCFGCGAGGNALSFVMEYENLDFPQAVESLAGTLGMEVPREQAPGRPEQPSRESVNKPLYELMERAALFYQQQLRNHPQAQRAVDYLKGRGLTGAVAKQFGLGFAPPGWDNLLGALGDSDEARRQLLQTGMLVENDKGSTYDRFRDRVMFPIRDRRGRVIAFGGRVLGDDKPKYLNSPETDIFHKGVELYGLYEARQNNRRLERIVVVEGYMDVIALAQHGISYATATLGTATSETHIQRIFRLCPEVVFCFDGDEAGRKAAVRALEATLPCMEDGRQARFLFLPEGMDPDDAVRGKGADYFEALMARAVPLEEFLFDAASDGLDTSTLEGRARMSKAALPYIRQLPEGVFRQLMFQALAERTGLELTSLMQLEVPPPAREAPDVPDYADLAAERSPHGPPDDDWPGATEWAPAPHEAPDPAGDIGPDSVQRGSASLAQRAITLILHQPAIAASTRPQVLDGLEGSDVSLLRELIELLNLRPDSNTGMLLGHWYGTAQGDLLRRLADAERVVPPEGIEREFADILAKLAHELPHHSKLRNQVDKLKVTNYAELSESEKQQLRELLQEKQRRDAQRSKSGS